MGVCVEVKMDIRKASSQLQTQKSLVPYLFYCAVLCIRVYWNKTEKGTKIPTPTHTLFDFLSFFFLSFYDFNLLKILPVIKHERGHRFSMRPRFSSLIPTVNN